MSEIQSKVTQIIVDKLGVEASAVKPEATFESDLGADSLSIVEVIIEFEKVFDVRIPDEEAEKIKTVGEAIACLEKHLKVKAQ